MFGIGKIGGKAGWVLGALGEVVDVITSSVPLPIPGMQHGGPLGDVLEPVGSAARSGADAVDRWLHVQRAHGTSGGVLADVRVDAARDGGSTQLSVDAHVSGASWGSTAAPCGSVDVFVDGVYHSSVLVLAERPGARTVDLGPLRPGAHHVELRAATGSTAVVGVDAVRPYDAAGDDADQRLVERFSPVLELRRLPGTARADALRGDDAPLEMIPAITRNADGSRSIEYRVVFSNEDGGTPLDQLLANYGRSVDIEQVYRVDVAADGRVLREQYQAPVHQWLPFDGERVGERPVLRVSTTNNLVSARTTPGGTRWAGAAAAHVDGSATDFEIMRAHPWVWRVMASELIREGKAAASGAATGSVLVGDPRRFVYLGPVGDAARAAIAQAGGVAVRLLDGRTVLAKVAKRFGTGRDAQTAVELPDGILGDAVSGVAILGVLSVVLGAQLDARELACAA